MPRPRKPHLLTPVDPRPEEVAAEAARSDDSSPGPEPKGALTIEQAMAWLGVSRTMLYRLIWEGDVKTVRLTLGGRVIRKPYVLYASLKAYLERCRVMAEMLG